MAIVKDRQTYFINQDMNGLNGTFSKYLSINDTDELRVVQVIYVGADADSVYRVAWHGLTDCLCLFDVQHQSGNVNIRHNVHGKSIQGTQNFTIHNPDGTIKTDIAGKLGIVFEAIKYR